MNASFLTDNENKSSQTKREMLRLLINNGTLSIAEFSKELGISVPTITKIINEMIDDGVLMDEGKIGTKGGRRPSVFGLNPDAGYFVGIDVARQHFHIAVADFKGNIIKFIQDIEYVLEANADSFKKICKLTQEKVAEAGIEWGSVLGVGISLSGRVNPEKGIRRDTGEGAGTDGRKGRRQ